MFSARLGRLTVVGCTWSGPFFVRFNPNGSPYRFWRGGPNSGFTNVEQFGGAFGSTCVSAAQLPNYKLVIAGTALVRLFPTGYLDPFHAIVALPEFAPQTIGPIHRLLVTADGYAIVATDTRRGVVIGRYRF